MFSAALYARARNLLLHCARDLGCSAHPAFPAHSVFEGERYANLGRNASRDRESVSFYSTLEMNRSYYHVIARSACDEAIHAAASGEMDCFASLAMTNSDSSRLNSTFLRLLRPHLHLAIALRPAFAVVLRAALDRHRIVGHVLGDDRAR